MIQSGGIFKRPDILRWHGNTQQLTESVWDSLGFGYSYGGLYRAQPWVYTPVNKIAGATARLPLKVYERTVDGREEARGTPYWELLNRPNPRIPKVTFWRWVRSVWDIYGESFLGKVRDQGGRPVQLVPLHPMHMKLDENTGTWKYDDGKRSIDIARSDFVWFRHFNPDGPRGLSPLEPLRATLENEFGARLANTSLWSNGGRPSVILSHPQTLTEPAATRIAASWQAVHGGVENWGKAAVLEEGLTATILPLNVEELQYIEARKLNREEVCAVYDIPPPALHILDRATFSNITEQMRSLYRDTMAPKLGDLESTLEWELRDGRLGEDRAPDFPDSQYAEFLMDEVLRGDFESRINAWAQAIQTGQATPAEARRAENRPFIEGSDSLLINAALVSVEPQAEDAFDKSDLDRVEALGQLVRAGFDPTQSATALGLPPIEHTGFLPVTVQPPPETQVQLRSLLGRLGRVKTVAELDPNVYTDPAIKGAIEAACRDGASVPEFKQRLRALEA